MRHGVGHEKLALRVEPVGEKVGPLLRREGVEDDGAVRVGVERQRQVGGGEVLAAKVEEAAPSFERVEVDAGEPAVRLRGLAALSRLRTLR